MTRILVIRGGAIGDFILTLPALKALRDAYPDARLEILGYKHIAVLVDKRFYADAVRSIEYSALSGFFAKNGTLDPELREYFGGFDLVISYLFDPDGIFEANLRKSGAGKIVCGPAKIRNDAPAARQLSEPIEQLGIKVNDCVAKIFPSTEDELFARDFLGGAASPLVALHVGSGSNQKNWPIENWIQLAVRLLGKNCSLLIISGEADQRQLNIVQQQLRDSRVRFATNLPLPQLAAVLRQCLFVGHDSGISHIAAAAGAKCIVLFGPTDPGVWAPQGDTVRVIRSATQSMQDVDVSTVADELEKMLQPLSGNGCDRLPS